MRLMRIAPPAAATMAAAFVCGSLARAQSIVAATVVGCAGLVLLFVTLTRLQMEQSRRLLEGSLAAVGDRVRIFGPVRLRWPGGGRLTLDYLVVGPGQRAWPVLAEGISQWPSPARAQAALSRRATQAAAAAEAVRTALREGGLPRSLQLPADARVEAIVVPLRRRVAAERRGGAVIANMEDLEPVLLGRQQFEVAPQRPDT